MRWTEFKHLILDSELAGHGRLARCGMRVARFAYFVATDLRENRCIERAATLSFVAILSLIPLSILFFSFAGLIGVGDRIIEYVKENVFPFVAPDFQEELSQWLKEYVSKKAFEESTAGIVGFLAVVSLIPAALAILATAERTFDRIWRARSRRSYLQRFTTFWVVLTTSPFLLIASTWVVDSPLSWISDDALPQAQAPAAPGGEESGTTTSPENPADGTAGQDEPSRQNGADVQKEGARSGWLRLLASLTIGFIAFTVLYVYLPSTNVRFSSAALGGLLASLLWEAAKGCFYLYVARTNTLYGQLAIVPLFLIWLYVSWFVVLSGCEFAYVHQNLAEFKRERRQRVSQLSELCVGLIFLETVAQAFVRGERAPRIADFGSWLEVDRSTVDSVVLRLVEAEIIAKTAGDRGRFLLARAPEKVRLEEVLDRLWEPGTVRLQVGLDSRPTGSDTASARLLTRAAGVYRETFEEMTLADLLVDAGVKGEATAEALG